MTPPDLSQSAKALQAFKRPIPVAVTFATPAGVIQTLEGAVAYREGDAILTGVKNEQWPVERNQFDSTYTPTLGTQSGQPGTYVKRFTPVWALQLDAPMEVAVGWQQNPIHGQSGDWLVQYAKDNYGIVSAAIFSETYQLMKESND